MNKAPHKNKGRKSKNRKDMHVHVVYDFDDTASVVMTTMELNKLIVRYNMPGSPIVSFTVAREPITNDVLRR